VYTKDVCCMFKLPLSIVVARQKFVIWNRHILELWTSNAGLRQVTQCDMGALMTTCMGRRNSRTDSHGLFIRTWCRRYRLTGFKVKRSRGQRSLSPADVMNYWYECQTQSASNRHRACSKSMLCDISLV